MNIVEERRDCARAAFTAWGCTTHEGTSDKERLTHVIRDLLHLGDELNVRPYEVLMAGWRAWLDERDVC
tara:strand:- start:160 stop:366 length:207 start_codon:yes stop_codon:yes gene_type:complete